jgi:hypothetical protein
LHAQLREIQVGAGAVAGGHRLAETALGVVAPECYAVDDNGKDFDDDFNNGTDE